MLLYIPHSSDKTHHLPPKSNIDNTPILGICQVVQVKQNFREPSVGN